MVEGCGFGGLDVGVAVDGGEDVVDVHGCTLGMGLWGWGETIAVTMVGFGGGEWWWVDKERSGDRAEWISA